MAHPDLALEPIRSIREGGDDPAIMRSDDRDDALDQLADVVGILEDVEGTVGIIAQAEGAVPLLQSSRSRQGAHCGA